MTARLTADDLFAGAGGWDVAANWLDIHARGVELMPEARETRAAAGLTTLHDDVWTFRPDGRASGLIASPPCQTFSTAGKGSGRKALDDVLTLLPLVPHMTLPELQREGATFGDDRTALVLTPLWFALHHPYRWLAWEQVPTVLPVWEACTELLHTKGWSVWAGILNAEQYGVPQTRRRAFLLASRDLEVTAPTPTHSRYYTRTPDKLDPGVAKWVSMAEALGWAEAELVGFPRRADSDDRVTIAGRDYRARDLRAADQPAQTVTEKARSWSRFSHMGDVYNTNGCVRSVDQPAPTMTGAMDNGNFRWHTPAVLAPAGTSSTVVDPRPVTEPAATITGAGNAEWGERPTRAPGPKQRDPKGVRVEVAEAGVLQSFPADHPWQGTKSKQYLQAGNAVPPLLAMAALSAALGEPYVPPAMTTTDEPAQPALAFL